MNDREEREGDGYFIAAMLIAMSKRKSWWPKSPKSRAHYARVRGTPFIDTTFIGPYV
jgi:hypothetical protein